MSIFQNLAWGEWLYGLVAAFISGGSGAVTSGIVVSSMDPKDYAIGGVNSIHLMCWVFVVQGLLGFFMYLKQAPLPSKVTVTTVTEKKILSTEPPTVVTRKVEETVVEAKKPEPKL